MLAESYWCLSLFWFE